MSNQEKSDVKIAANGFPDVIYSKTEFLKKLVRAQGQRLLRAQTNVARGLTTPLQANNHDNTITLRVCGQNTFQEELNVIRTVQEALINITPHFNFVSVSEVSLEKTELPRWVFSTIAPFQDYLDNKDEWAISLALEANGAAGAIIYYPHKEILLSTWSRTAAYMEVRREDDRTTTTKRITPQELEDSGIYLVLSPESIASPWGATRNRDGLANPAIVALKQRLG